jgi:hypothetical protein
MKLIPNQQLPKKGKCKILDELHFDQLNQEEDLIRKLFQEHGEGIYFIHLRKASGQLSPSMAKYTINKIAFNKLEYVNSIEQHRLEQVDIQQNSAQYGVEISIKK